MKNGLYNYQDVFKYLDQLSIWSDIIGKPVRLGEMICNPLRSDNNPSCYLREYNDVILMTDFGYPEYNKYTCVHAVAHLNNIRLLDAARLIFCRKYTAAPPQRPKSKKAKPSFHFVSYVTKDNKPTYRKQDAEYWLKRGINSNQLRKHNVYAVHHYYLNDKVFYNRNLLYAYVDIATGNTKMYQPNSKYRFPYSSIDKNHINKGNTHIKSDKCIITKSLKDLMILENLFPDINIFSFESESMIPDDLSIFDDYEVYVLYDNDTAGIKGSKKVANKLNGTELFIDPNVYVGCTDVDEIMVKQPHLINKFKDVCLMTFQSHG